MGAMVGCISIGCDMQVPTVGGQQQQGDSFMQMDGGKFHQPGQDQQGGFMGTIPITAQAGMIEDGDGMED